jgi:hypothetical protein
MPPDEATELIETKLAAVASDSEAQGIDLTVNTDVISRVVALSGGHPHILQLLGSHLIEHENDDPDGVIDSHDLLKSLHRVCYEDRARVYDSTLHTLAVHHRLDSLASLLRSVPYGFPTKIDRDIAHSYVDKESLEWLVKNNILLTQTPEYYGLVDEFLRIRLMLDSPGELNPAEIERAVLEDYSVFQDDEIDPRFSEDFYYRADADEDGDPLEEWRDGGLENPEEDENIEDDDNF